MALQAVWMQAYMETPPVTRFYATACVLTTAAVQLNILSPLQLYFNPNLIWNQLQVWRLFTTFLFFGNFNFNFIFNMIFTYKYCRMLEESSFHGKTADFVVMFLFGIASMIFFALFVNQILLGPAFTLMLVYVWSRRNPMIRMNFFGLLVFRAPYLPWVLLVFSFLMGRSITVELLGMVVGHFYYFLQDVFPAKSGGIRVLKTPRVLAAIFDPVNEDPNYNPLPEERPGGFEWGNNGAGAAAAAPDQQGNDQRNN